MDYTDRFIGGRADEVPSRKGRTLDRDEYDTMLSEFYDLRGWDPESGLQTADKLERLELSDIIPDLKKKDLLKT